MVRTSHRERRSEKSSRRKKRSSSSSDRSSNGHRIKRLEALVTQLSNSSTVSSTHRSSTQYRNICTGDELMIPIFNPLKEIITIEQWVKKVDELAKLYDWDDRSVFRLIIRRLEEHAKEWFQLQQSNIITWAETKVALVQHFHKSTRFAKLLREAVNYETSPNQDLGDYCLNKLNKIRQCNLGVSEEYIIDLVIDGVKNNRIKGDIRAAGKTTTNALYNHMLTLGKTPTLFKQQRESKDDYSRRPGGAISTKQCYNCGVVGHISRKCWNT